jgi:hypothetical protein
MAARDFDRLFKKEGGRLKKVPGGESILGPEWFRRRYWDYLRKLQKVDLYRPGLRRVYFDFVNNPALNAAAGSTRNRLLVGLYHGALDSLGTFFNTVLSSPDVFTHVGKPEDQVKWFDDLRAWNWTLSMALAWEDFRKSTGKEPTLATGKRQEFAGHLLMFALDFIVFHEVGHWLGGHDRFAKEVTSEFGLPLNELEPTRLSPVLNQLLELNADAFAINFMTNEFFQVNFGPESIFPSAEEALRMWSTAMAFTFVLFGQEQKIRPVMPLDVRIHPHPGLLTSYPHPMMRMYNAQLTLHNMAMYFGDEAVDVARRAWEAGISDVVQTCEVLRLPSSTMFADPETIERGYQALSMSWLWGRKKLDGCTRLNIS